MSHAGPLRDAGVRSAPELRLMVGQGSFQADPRVPRESEVVVTPPPLSRVLGRIEKEERGHQTRRREDPRSRPRDEGELVLMNRLVPVPGTPSADSNHEEGEEGRDVMERVARNSEMDEEVR